MLILAEVLLLAVIFGGWAIKGFQDPASMLTIAIGSAGFGFLAGLMVARRWFKSVSQT